jgi:cytochrome c oxidase subunit IV
MSDTQHKITPKTYYQIFGFLMLFTAITVAVAFVDLGPLNIAVAIGIAILKAVLVVLYFMHVRYSEQVIWIYIGSAVFCLLLLIAYLYGDFWTRSWIHVSSF